jgi:hypothetical protein
MNLADRAIQFVSRLGNGDQIKVIGHQTIRPDLDLLGAAPLGRQLMVAQNGRGRNGSRAGSRFIPLLAVARLAQQPITVSRQ